MEQKSHDKVFFANFGVVMGALFIIFLICVAAASLISPEIEPGEEAFARVEQRIRPVGRVITDPAALVKVSAAASRTPYTGAEVAAKVCNGCHLSGVLGAPKEGDRADWTARLQAAGGLDGLVANAIEGKNAMPPRGGDPDLSDEEMKAGVEYLVKGGV